MALISVLGPRRHQKATLLKSTTCVLTGSVDEVEPVFLRFLINSPQWFGFLNTL